MALACLTLCRLMHIHSPTIARSMLQDEEPIAQLRMILAQ